MKEKANLSRSIASSERAIELDRLSIAADQQIIGFAENQFGSANSDSHDKTLDSTEETTLGGRKSAEDLQVKQTRQLDEVLYCPDYFSEENALISRDKELIRFSELNFKSDTEKPRSLASQSSGDRIGGKTPEISDQQFSSQQLENAIFERLPLGSIISRIWLFILWLVGDRSSSGKGSVRDIRRQNQQIRWILRSEQTDNSTMADISNNLFDGRFYVKKVNSILKSPFRVAIYTILDLFSDICVSVLYFVEMELENGAPDQVTWYIVKRPYVIWIILVVLSFYNLISFLMRLAFSENRRAGSVGILFVIDLLTSVPFIVMLFLPVPLRYQLYVPYFLRAWLITRRIKRVLELQARYQLFGVKFDLIQERIIILTLTILSIIYTGACAFQYTEDVFNGLDFSLFEAIYFIVITMSTVGYGDVSPVSAAAKVVVVAVIIVALAILPNLIADTVTAINQKSGEGEEVDIAPEQFVIVVSSLDCEDDVRFISQQIISSEINQCKQLIFCAPKHPSDQLIAFFRKSGYKNRVSFVKIYETLEETLLKKAKLSKASACILLVDRVPGSEWSIVDGMIQLKTLAIRRAAPYVKLYVTHCQPDTMQLIKPYCDKSFCHETTSQMLMAYNCLYPGSATLLTNLVVRKDTNFVPENAWIEQYSDGLENDVYTTDLNPILAGLSFIQLAIIAYEEFQAVALGVKVWVSSESTWVLMLNPGKHYKLQTKDQLILLCQGAHTVKFINQITNRQLDKVLERIASREVVESNQVQSSKPQKLKESFEHPKAFLGQVYSRRSLPDNNSGRLCILAKPEYRKSYSEARLNNVAAKFTTKESFILAFVNHFELTGLLTTLRSAQLSAHLVKPLVLFSRRPPTREEWEWVSQFHEIYHVQGDVHNSNDLVRSGVLNAKSVILAQLTGDGGAGSDVPANSLSMKLDSRRGSSDDLDQPSADSTPDPDGMNGAYYTNGAYSATSHQQQNRNVLVYRRLVHVCKQLGRKNLPIFTELADRKEIQFIQAMDPALSVPENKNQFSQKLHTFTHSITNTEQNFIYQSPYTSGSVFFPSVLDALAIRSMDNRDLSQVIQAMCGVWDDWNTNLMAKALKVQENKLNQDQISPARLHIVKVPEEFIGKPFGHLFSALAFQHGVVSIGLHRRCGFTMDSKNSSGGSSYHAHSQEGSKSSKGQNLRPSSKPQSSLFVWTNPLMQTYLFAQDRVFVLKETSSNANELK